MATVRFSKELQTAILNNARRVFNKRIAEAEDSAPKDWGDRIYDIIFAQYIPSLNALPSEFFSTSAKFRFEGFADDDTINYASFDMPLVTSRPFPSKSFKELEFFTVKSGYSNNEYRLKSVPEFAEFKQLVVAWKARCNQATEQRKQFVESVEKVITSHATLAPALKMWPPLWDLVPEEYKERHREVTDRTKKDTPTVDVDLNKMTAIATAAKIGGL